MGTLVEVVAYPDTGSVRDVVAKAFDKMEAIEAATDHRRDGSSLAALKKGGSITVSDDLMAILTSAISIARDSSGAFDPTMGKVVGLWGFDRDDPRLPDAKELKNALLTVGFTRISMEGNVVRADAPVWLDLGGIAKGYAVDEAVRLLEESGVQAGIVNAGGDLRVFGKRPGRRNWRIGVQDPDDFQSLIGVLELEGGAVATSGDYERYFEIDGKRYHHILDPATGFPARSGLRSVTVLAPDGLQADGLATAAFVMGPERGLKFLDSRSGIQAILVTGNGKMLTTDGIGSEVGFERR